jgi:hypothetical protein
MATSVTIAPTVGHPVLATQGGVGATPGYDAIDIRRMVEAGPASQEGVFNATGWKVTQDTGSNLKVQVAANVGLAVVQGDSITFQSRYVVAPHSAVATLDIGSNASGNPRLDQIVLQVRDNTHDGSGQNDARVLVLAGTATSGATLDVRSGAAALPSGAIRLADVLVANGATAITNAVVRDRRPWARGALFTYVRTAGNYTVGGTTYADLDATNLKPRIELSGVPLRVMVSGRHSNATGGTAPTLAVSINAAAEIAAQYQPYAVMTSGSFWGNNIAYDVVIPAPSAGSALVAVRVKTDSAFPVTVSAVAGDELHVDIHEDPRSGSHYNG